MATDVEIDSDEDCYSFSEDRDSDQDSKASCVVNEGLMPVSKDDLNKNSSP